jgi:glycosyltransferase involved in cell wall biosynthesis
MRIAMILRPDADRVFGGDTVVMEKLSAALRERGVDVALGKQEDLPPASEFDLLHIFTIAPLDHAQRMVDWARRGGAAIVFSPLYYNDYRDWFARAIVKAPRWSALARRLGKARAWRIYRSWQTARQPLQPVWRAMRELLINAEVVATTSRWENEFVADHFRLPADVRSAMRLSRFGVDTRLYGRQFTGEQLECFRTQYGLAPGYVLEVARIESKKNQLALIQALWDDPVDIVFVGTVSPYFEPDYAERCRKAGEQRGRVHFLGWIPKADLPLMYAASAAHALPSWNELPGLSSLEAGACGTRLVSTRYSPLPEMLGEQAHYCDPYDVNSIRSAVRSALECPVPPVLRQRLLAEYSWDEAARVNLAPYEKVLQAPRLAPAA